MTQNSEILLIGYKQGKRHQLAISNSTVSQAIMTARRKGYRNVKVRHRRKFFLVSMRLFKRSINPKTLMIFTRKLAGMLKAGLPVIDALDVLVDQASDKTMKAILRDISTNIRQGVSMRDAFGRHDDCFDIIYLNMIEAGEISGKLDAFLIRLAGYLEARQKIKSSITSALFYPITLLVITIGISLFMLISVVPVFAEMFASLGAELPAPTQFLVDASDWLAQPLSLFGLVASLSGLVSADRLIRRYVYRYRLFWSWLSLSLPIIGGIIIKSQIARICQLLTNLIEAGVALPTCLDIASTGSNNLLIKGALERISTQIMSGRPLSDLFADEPVFPPELAQLIAVGERTGTLDQMLDALSRYYTEDYETILSGLTTIIEPVMIVFIGAVIGGLVLALYLPIFSAGSVLSSG